VRVEVFYGGVGVEENRKILKDEKTAPHIVIGTPGRILQLSKDGDLKLSKLKRFILDECDQLLEKLDMRKDVQDIFRLSPHDKQVMMFSATLSKEVRPICKKFMYNPLEIFINDSNTFGARREPEEQKTRRSSRFPQLQPTCHLRQVQTESKSSEQDPPRDQLSFSLHLRRSNETNRKNREIQKVQEL